MDSEGAKSSGLRSFAGEISRKYDGYVPPRCHADIPSVRDVSSKSRTSQISVESLEKNLQMFQQSQRVLNTLNFI